MLPGISNTLPFWSINCVAQTPDEMQPLLAIIETDRHYANVLRMSFPILLLVVWWPITHLLVLSLDG